MTNIEWFAENDRLIEERKAAATIRGWTMEDSLWLLAVVEEAAQRALNPWKFAGKTVESTENP